MHYRQLVILSVILLLFSGCGARTDGNSVVPGASASNSDAPSTSSPADSEPEGPGYIGYVTMIAGDRILVVSPADKDFSSSGGVSHYYEAIWFSNVPSDIELGMKVEVWAGAIAESYPAQGKADRVSVRSEPKPEGAKLSEAEAIRQAIASHSEPEGSFPVVAGAEYSASDSSWTVSLANAERDAFIPIRIEDK